MYTEYFSRVQKGGKLVFLLIGILLQQLQLEASGGGKIYEQTGVELE